MAYLDSNGNVDPTAGKVVEQWAEFHRTQNALPVTIRGAVVAPVTSLPAGGEKASRGHD
jgi:hypothetical protein